MGGLERAILTVCLIFVTGVLGFIPLFSDSPSLWINVAEIFVVFTGGGFFIGLIAPRRWWVAGFAGWPVLLLAGVPLLTTWIFRDAPVVTASVTEGSIRVVPDTLLPERIRFVHRNEGEEVHELGIYALDDGEGTPRTLEDFRSSDLRSSFRPLEPGQQEVSHLAAGLLRPGSYAVACLRTSEEGVPHAATGEVAEIHVRMTP